MNYKNLFCSVIYRGEKIEVISELNNRRWVEWIMSWLYNAILSVIKQIVVLVFIITRKVVYYIKLNFKKQATKQFEFDTHFVKIRHACAPLTHTQMHVTQGCGPVCLSPPLPTLHPASCTPASEIAGPPSSPPNSLIHLSGALRSQTSVLDLFSCRSLLYFLMICLSHQNETPWEQGTLCTSFTAEVLCSRAVRRQG